MQFGKSMADVHPEVVCQLVEDGVYDTATIIGYELKPCKLEQNLEPEPCRESDASSVHRVSFYYNLTGLPVPRPPHPSLFLHPFSPFFSPPPPLPPPPPLSPPSSSSLLPSGSAHLSG